MFKTKPSNLSKYLVFKSPSIDFLDSKGFSIIGVLVASAVGIIVSLGLAKVMTNINTEVGDLKKEANQIGLVSQLSGLLKDCQPILSKSIDANNLQRGEEIVFSELKDGNGVTILYVGEDSSKSSEKERAKKMYGLEGHTAFKLSCQDTDCDCSSSQPCSKNWILSLFTMSYKNNLPMYKEVLSEGLRITYNTSDVEDFTCNFGAKLQAVPQDPICLGGRAWNGSACACPDGTKLRRRNCYCTEDTNGKIWNGSACVCPERSTWDGSKCACPQNSIRQSDYSNNCNCLANLRWDEERRECNCLWASPDAKLLRISGRIYCGINKANTPPAPPDPTCTGGRTWYRGACVCPGGNLWDGSSCQPPSGGGDTSVGGGGGNVNLPDLNSSREYKKNIVLFEGYEEILESILRTPLFTYEYKEDYPEKERLGVIAEDLPESLKLPGELGDPVKPDWVSIQGYLWAGIKALHKELLDLKAFVSVSLELLESSIKKDIKSTEESLREELESLKSDQEILKKRFEELEKEKALLKMEVEKYKQKE